MRKSLLLAAGLAVVVLVWIADYATGPELGFYLFYLIPIFLVTWFEGLVSGVIVSVVSALAWFAADALTSGPYFALHISIWNTAIRLFTFLLLTYSLWMVRQGRKRQRGLIEFIVHDLRNPVTAISEGLSIFLERSGGRIDAHDRELIDICTISCKRTVELINSILDLSRLESRKMPLEVRDIDIKELTAVAVREVSAFAARSGVSLESSIGDGIGTIRSDKNLVFRVLINLLSNAVKASGEGQAVTLSVTASAPGRVEFCVEDHGKGIPKGMERALFGKFTQIRAREQGIVWGSGLGLAFCRLAVKELGGTIRLESEEGKGTRVVVTLPVLARGRSTSGQ